MPQQLRLQLFDYIKILENGKRYVLKKWKRILWKIQTFSLILLEGKNNKSVHKISWNNLFKNERKI